MAVIGSLSPNSLSKKRGTEWKYIYIIVKKCASLHLHWDDTWSDERLYLQDPALLTPFWLSYPKTALHCWARGIAKASYQHYHFFRWKLFKRQNSVNASMPLPSADLPQNSTSNLECLHGKTVDRQTKSLNVENHPNSEFHRLSRLMQCLAKLPEYGVCLVENCQKTKIHKPTSSTNTLRTHLFQLPFPQTYCSPTELALLNE